jgi:hypothetical protein
MLSDRYDPPLPLNQLPKHLQSCPIHYWRAKTGIELIHEEPDYNEFIRIWRNWKLMTPEQKKASDKKSIELFGIDNQKHFRWLYTKYSSTLK